MSDNLKLSVIEKGIPKLLNQLNWFYFTKDLDKLPLEVLLDLGYSREEVVESYRVNNSYFQKLKRIRKRLVDMESDYLKNTNYNLLFLTFTFNDSTLISTSDKTKRTYVRRFLKEYALKYIANVDYGSENGRIHYHAVALINGDLDYTIWSKKLEYGSLNGQRVRIKNSTPKRLAKYIQKLSLHSIKESTQFQRLIYSRS